MYMGEAVVGETIVREPIAFPNLFVAHRTSTKVNQTASKIVRRVLPLKDGANGRATRETASPSGAPFSQVDVNWLHLRLLPLFLPCGFSSRLLSGRRRTAGRQHPKPERNERGTYHFSGRQRYRNRQPLTCVN